MPAFKSVRLDRAYCLPNFEGWMKEVEFPLSILMRVSLLYDCRSLDNFTSYLLCSYIKLVVLLWFIVLYFLPPIFLCAVFSLGIEVFSIYSTPFVVKSRIVMSKVSGYIVQLLKVNTYLAAGLNREFIGNYVIPDLSHFIMTYD